MYTLRPYQETAVRDAMSFLKESKKTSGIIVQPVGAGKSICIANIAKELGEPVLVLQPSKELLMQNYGKYVSYGLEASIYSASLKQKEIGEVTFATPGSIKSIPEEFSSRGVRTIIVDECHYASGKGMVLDRFIKKAGIKKVIGLTATPVVLANGMFGSELRMMNRTRKSFYQDIIHVTQISELSENGFWTKLEYDPRKVDKSPLKFNTTGSDYTEESMKNFYDINLMRRKVVEACDELIAKGRKHILCFVALVDEAREIQKMMPDYSVAVWGDMSAAERDEAIRRFKEGEVEVALNVNVLGTGFDYPMIDGCVHARPTGSLSLYYQHIGRLVRIHPDKDSAVIVDLSGNYDKFGKVEILTFENDKERANGWCMKSGNKILTVTNRPDVDTPYKSKTNPDTDGVDHINVYSKSKSELGQLLSNFAYTPFTIKDKWFPSVESFWYYIKACNAGLPENQREEIRTKSGYKAKEYWKGLGDPPAEEPNHTQLKIAYKQKLREHPHIVRMLMDNTLPLMHYYVFDGTVVPAKHGWTVELWNEIKREILQQPVA